MSIPEGRNCFIAGSLVRSSVSAMRLSKVSLFIWRLNVLDCLDNSDVDWVEGSESVNDECWEDDDVVDWDDWDCVDDDEFCSNNISHSIARSNWAFFLNWLANYNIRIFIESWSHLFLLTVVRYLYLSNIKCLE